LLHEDEFAMNRVVQRRDSSGFTLETLAELLRGNLDGNLPGEPRVNRAVHFAHTVGAKSRLDLIPP
jgi:hypothetical protein